MRIKIEQVQFKGGICDIVIENKNITQIVPAASGEFDRVIDGRGKLASAPFYNTHCHAAMTLLRGIADNLELFDWLNNYIWPAEERMRREDIYIGSKLAMLEMIKSGTVFFNDMYFSPAETVRAAEEMGIRAAIGMIAIDTAAPDKRAEYAADCRELWERRREYSDLIQLTLAPHAIYTVGEAELRKIAERSEAEQLPIHIHLAETVREVEECKALHGCSPVEYLDKLGLLGPRTLAAHAVHLSEKDIEIMSERSVTAAYMPCSNYKLSSGRFQFRKMLDSKVRVTLGTDGCASNDNLSMFDEMKFGALGAKIQLDTPTACSASEIFNCATAAGAEAFGINGGIIAAGKVADIMLIDLDSPMMVADHNPVSNLVWSADSSCVDTVICNGRILMQNRIVPNEKEIIAQARSSARRLLAP